MSQQEKERATQRLAVLEKSIVTLKTQLKMLQESSSSTVLADQSQSSLLAQIQQNSVLRESNAMLRQEKVRADKQVLTCRHLLKESETKREPLEARNRELESEKRALEATKKSLEEAQTYVITQNSLWCYFM